ncbi:MAG: hypothetical protein ACE5R6_11030 [Candidatus Heimdallarchaeota archaeon]
MVRNVPAEVWLGAPRQLCGGDAGVTGGVGRVAGGGEGGTEGSTADLTAVCEAPEVQSCGIYGV